MFKTAEKEQGHQEIQRSSQEQQSSPQEISPEQYDGFLYKFQQQIIDAWKPLNFSAIICIGLGIAILVTLVSTQQIIFRYDNLANCSFGFTNCSTTVTINQKLSAPVYLYYGMTNFYQNHRRYIKYFSSQQLNNGLLSESDVSLSFIKAYSSCGSFITNSQLGYTNNYYNNNTILNPNNVGFPCGTSGRIYNKFRPELLSFKFFHLNNSQIAIAKNGIAWSSDIGRHKNWDLNQQPFSVEEEDWLVWYRPAARSDFFKLFGIVNTEIPAGVYTFQFSNTFNASFGQKKIFIGKANYLGNKDLFLGVAFLVLGGGCLILLVVFIAKWISQKRDKAHIN